MSLIQCPHCGEPTDTFVDPSGGEEQEFVEDCVVCCRPIRFVAVYSEEDREFRIDVFEE